MRRGFAELRAKESSLPACCGFVPRFPLRTSSAATHPRWWPTTPPWGQPEQRVPGTKGQQHPRRERAAPRCLEPALRQRSRCQYRHSVQRRRCSRGLHRHHGPCSPACLLSLRSESWLWRPLLVGGGSPNPMCPPCGSQQPGEAPLVSFLSSAAHLSSL